MKTSKVNRGIERFFSIRRVCRTTGGTFFVCLPKQWCLSNDIDNFREMEIVIFPTALLMIPPSKRLKVNELADQIPEVVRVMELKEELEDAIKNVEELFQNYPRRHNKGTRC